MNKHSSIFFNNIIAFIFLSCFLLYLSCLFLDLFHFLFAFNFFIDNDYNFFNLLSAFLGSFLWGYTTFTHLSFLNSQILNQFIYIDSKGSYIEIPLSYKFYFNKTFIIYSPFSSVLNIDDYDLVLLDKNDKEIKKHIKSKRMNYFEISTPSKLENLKIRKIFIRNKLKKQNILNVYIS